MKLPALRPYQVPTVAAVVAMARELGSVLLCSATGSGKTVMGLHAAHQLAEGGVVLWLAPSLGLIEQTADRVRDAGVEPRILQAGDTGPRDAPVIVASVPTLLAMLRRGEALPACAVVVHDEARGHLAPQWREVARGVAARYRLGLDATPCRADGVALGDLFAGLVQGPPVSDLIEAGALCPVTIRAPKERGSKLAAHPVAAYERLLAGGRAVVYCRDKSHAEEVAGEAVRRGHRAAFVHEGTRDRAAVISAFRSGDVKLVANVLSLYQGFDLPALRGVIIARGVSHVAAWIQIVGRVGRACGGKTSGLVIDLLGSYHSVGCDFEAPLLFSLTGEPIRRAGDPLPSSTQCLSCLGWGPGGMLCRTCGVPRPPPPPPAVRARDLIDVRAARDGAPERLATLRRYVEQAMAKGHSPWRATHIYRGTYGEDPSKADMIAAIREVQHAAQA